jgi:hypothetical protein
LPHSAASLAALMLALALAACGGSGPMRSAGEPIERGTALPPPGLEAPPARR